MPPIQHFSHNLCIVVDYALAANSQVPSSKDSVEDILEASISNGRLFLPLAAPEAMVCDTQVTRLIIPAPF